MTWLLIIIVILAATFIPTVGDIVALVSGSALIYVGAILLSFASWLLDQALIVLVTQLDATLFGTSTPGFAQGINDVWRVFRDIANILIIGMFTFTAIAMILGIQNFNARKMVARVLLIAILINFSMLFTRTIVAGTNFVATEFYKYMNIGGSVQGQIASDPSTRPSTGLGGVFMVTLGLDRTLSWNNVEETVAQVFSSGRSNNEHNGRVLAIFFGLTLFMIMFVTSFIFAYIVFLIITRAILIVFLLMTSALAFAAYLVPKWGDQYWSMWWNSLLRSAAIAPFLMMMLYATLIMARALSDNGAKTASLAQIFKQGGNDAGVKALLFIIVILGMLFASARFAQSFAKSIPGFSFASAIPAGALAIGDRLGGFLLRRGGGLFNSRAATLAGRDQSALADRLQGMALNDPGRASVQRQLARATREKMQAEKRMERTYEFGQTATGKKMFDFLQASKGTYGGAVTTEKARRDEIARSAAEFGRQTAEAMKPSKAAQDAIREDAAKTAKAEHARDATTLEGDRNAAEQNLNSQRGAHETERDEAEKIRKQIEKELEDLRSNRDALPAGHSGRAAYSADIDTRTGDLAKENLRIENAQKALKTLQDTFDTAAKTYADHVANEEATVEKAASGAVKEFVERADKMMDETAQRAAKREVWRAAPITAAVTKVVSQARTAASKSLDPKEQDKALWQKFFGDKFKSVEGKLGSK